MHTSIAYPISSSALETVTIFICWASANKSAKTLKKRKPSDLSQWIKFLYLEAKELTRASFGFRNPKRCVVVAVRLKPSLVLVWAASLRNFIRSLVGSNLTPSPKSKTPLSLKTIKSGGRSSSFLLLHGGLSDLSTTTRPGRNIWKRTTKKKKTHMVQINWM